MSLPPLWHPACRIRRSTALNVREGDRMAKKDTPAGAAKCNGSVKKLRKLMRDIRIAMLTTVSRDGGLRSRPMMTSEVEFDGNLWFIASGRSTLAEEITTNANV